jgi:uncharacterized short protein YbdD (DUF466 family)
MAITDLQISEELMTDAPSIKYRGDEGPKSPQEEQQMMVDALLKEEYNNYVYDLLEQRPDATPMSFEEFRRMVIAEGQMSGGQPLPQDPTEPVNPFKPKPIGPVLPDKRQMAAFGGIIGVDGRRQYGIGSWFQKAKDKVVDDLIPNEIKDNPILTAALVAGGDQLLNQGRITNTVLDSILGKQQYGDTDMEPLGRSGGILETIKNLGTGAKDATVEFLGKPTNPDDPKSKTYGQTILSSIGKNIIPALGGIAAGLFTKNTESDTPGLPSDTTALNLAELKKGANLATQKQGLAANLNFLPAVETRLFSPEEMAITYAQAAANGGRIGFNMGGGADMGAPQMNAAQATEEIIIKIMQKMQDPNLTDEDRAFLQAQLQVFAMPKNQAMTSAMGNKEFMNSFIEQELNRGSSQEEIKQKITDSFDITVPNIDPKFIKKMPKEFDMFIKQMDPEFINQMPEGFETAKAMGGRISAQEGGLMDLGGLEKDYRAEGGFVPIGREEKADDVPARLSVNEFVFTADAVRNAGGGDIDEGAKVMENMMKHLEAGGQVSEESQGMAGARDMFATSQRLSEVV